LFTGGKPVEVKILADETMGSKDFRIGIVTFPSGTRNLNHIHDNEQILYVLQGKGIVATDSKEGVVNEDDVIIIPAGEKHWHGATVDSVFSHLFLIKTQTKTSY